MGFYLVSGECDAPAVEERRAPAKGWYELLQDTLSMYFEAETMVARSMGVNKIVRKLTS